MTIIELLQIAAPLVGLGGVLFRVGVYSSEINQRIMRVESALMAKNAELRTDILLKLKDLSSSQDIDSHKFTDLERQIGELHHHLRDAERKLEKSLGYSRRPYSMFEDTQARKRLPDGSWVGDEG
ncbi:MAG: hypothetical protein SAJ12_09025 [Jaaginema sp. PMC 1079.18]|nr:hypothetical protein [Jaaginema sp. PMC 1080.18]MEC4851143.1 hypothetical protein [Jaaginema sp. PMC 1079.18]MEC4866382.1 hypothetical protein [Jaaginema sp. PMC 1078.18]